MERLFEKKKSTEVDEFDEESIPPPLPAISIAFSPSSLNYLALKINLEICLSRSLSLLTFIRLGTNLEAFFFI